MGKGYNKQLPKCLIKIDNELYVCIFLDRSRIMKKNHKEREVNTSKISEHFRSKSWCKI